MNGKLVRDLIPDIIRGNGQTPITRIADTIEYTTKLRDKLREEVEEFLQSGDLEELADILEVVTALAAPAGLSRDDLESLRASKAAERGAFTRGFIWLGNEEQT